MAIEIATAFVQIVPSMKGVGKAIESAFGSASETAGNTAGIKAGNGFAGGFGAKLGVITGIAQSVAGKAIEAFMGLSGEITSASDSAQKFASTLNFAGVSEQQIKRLTASTQDYADKTVYDLNDIRNTTAQLAANGVPNYDKLAEAAGNLNAVAGGSADTFKSVAMVLTQTAGQGKLTTENWNQLSDAIPGASGKIQQALKEAGAYTGNFRDAMADGQITAQEFNDAIMSLGFTDAAVEAATSASTIEGATGNLEAAFVKLGASVLDSVKPAITGGMSWIADGVTNAVPVVQAGIEGLIGWFQRLYSKLEENGAITAFKSAWDTIRDAIMGVVNMVIDWAHMIPPEGLADGIKLVADTLNWFIQHGKELAPIIIGIGTAFAAVKGYQALNSGLQALTGTMNTVTTAAKGISNGIMLMMDLGGPIQMLKQMGSSLSLVKTAQTAWSAATKMATAVQGAFNAVIAANPIGAIAVAIAAVVATLVWFFTQTEVGRKAWPRSPHGSRTRGTRSSPPRKTYGTGSANSSPTYGPRSQVPCNPHGTASPASSRAYGRRSAAASPAHGRRSPRSCPACGPASARPPRRSSPGYETSSSTCSPSSARSSSHPCRRSRTASTPCSAGYSRSSPSR